MATPARASSRPLDLRLPNGKSSIARLLVAGNNGTKIARTSRGSHIHPAISGSTYPFPVDLPKA